MSSSSEYETDSESSGDDRMQANALWTQMTRPPVPLRIGRGSVSDSESESDQSGLAGAHTNGLGLHNTAFQYHKRPAHAVLMLDSLDRDPVVYPLPTSLRLKLPRIYRNIIQIDVVQVRLLNGIVPFSLARGNTSMSVLVGAGPASTIAIDDGNYTLTSLLAAVQTALGSNFTVSYSPAGFMKITNTVPTAFTLQFLTGLPTSQVGKSSSWGLGWSLGFGGPPKDLTGDASNSYTVMATAFPRLFDEYVFLRLNEAELMNGIDHTSPENTAISQDSTGQVSHYFGKLLLNGFGGYCQTLIEMPRRFNPVLGRLDRINVDWLDRNGQPLGAYTGAASCDWNMTLRITELVEGTAASSAVTFSQAGGVNDDFGMDQNPPYIR